MAEITLDPADRAEWDALRSIAHRMTDDMIDYLADARSRAAWKPVPSAVKAALDEPVPLQPTPLATVYDEFSANILPYPTGNGHPRFWGWVMGTGSPVGMLAEMLTGAMNAHVSGYDQGAAVVERQVIRWLVELLGFPVGTSGLFVSGGTAANLVGLTVARNSRAGFDIRRDGLQIAGAPRLLAYASSETHGWATRSCEMLGLGRDALRRVPVDANFRIDVDELARMIGADQRDGHRPFCVIGNAGTVNTGAIDDLDALAHICRKEGLWFHVDGAFGALAALAPELSPLVHGMQHADSLAFDLHKWGYVQYEAGCIIVRDHRSHREAFASTPEYLRQARGGIAVEPLYFADLGIQLSRSFRALKVWMTLKTQGAARWGQLIRQNVDQARYLEQLVTDHSELELLAPVSLNVVCFRFVVPGLTDSQLDSLNEDILVAVQTRGIGVPSSTTLLHGGKPRFALRVAITNHRTNRNDLREFAEAVVAIGRELHAAA